jgi:predicted RNA-binding protein with PUA-like domain
MSKTRRRYWLFKTEPQTYSIADLAAEAGGVGRWDGVRNYQARNLLRDEVQVGDGVLVYHSSADVIGVAGVARVVRAGYVDPTQLDPESSGFDRRARPEAPPWVSVDLRHEETFGEIVAMAAMRADARLAGMLVIKRGQRLSIQPVTPEHWRRVLVLGRRAVAT